MAAVFVYTSTMMNAILLLYSCCDHTVEGRVTTTLPEVATVCNGSQLELNCTITGSVLEWIIIPEQNHSQLSALMHSPIRNESFPYEDSTITFTISHSMEPTSYIVISPIINSLNGTEVMCTDLEDQESSSTVINVVNEQDFESIMVRTISEDFNRVNVEVSLEWVPDNSLHTYHVNIIPQPAFSMRLKRNSIHLKVEYNVLYNFSIVTVSPCGQTLTINETLYYDGIIPNLTGTDVVPSTNFELDNSEGGDPLTVVVASLSTVLLVFSLITFIVGFLCGHWFGRKFKGPLNQASSAHPPRAPIAPPVPIYESMLPDITHEEQAIELEENVAYGPSMLMNVS